MYEELFELAKDKGIESLELYIFEENSISMNLFHGELDDYQVSNSKSILARGIFNKRMGYVSLEKYDKKTARFIVNSIIKNANIITSNDKVEIYAGDKEYKNINVYNPELFNIPLENKIEFLKKVEKEALAYNPMIVEVADNGYSESCYTVNIINDKGLNLKRVNNSCSYYCSVVARDKTGDKDGSYIYYGNDYNKLKVDEIVKEACDEAISKLGSGPIKSGAYKIVLDSKMMATFVSLIVDNCCADIVQKGYSLLANKLDTKIAGENFTIKEDPWLEKSISSTGFDDEGVATYPKTIIDKGVLKTYLYNLKTALKDGTKSTGNGFRTGSEVGTDVRNVYLIPGTKSKKELFDQVNNGVYITDLSGLNAGMDPISGNFSLQASGFIIENGKQTKPVSVITVAGNIFNVINNIEELGNDDDYIYNPNVKAPSAIINGLIISGL